MKCSCGTPHPARSDRPHVFVKQERSACPGCSELVEVRTVLRQGQAWRLRHCPRCGQSEERIAEDGAAWLDGWLAQARGLSGERVFKKTTSTCPRCLALIEANVVLRDGRVYFDKVCASCGPSRALVSEDAAWYLNAYSFSRAGSQPLEVATRPDQGCPRDCGLCTDHEQHTCVPMIEVTDFCNLECPICLVDNRNARHMSNDEFAGIIDRIVRSEGTLESVALSGGEPTSHPRILELIDLATRPEIGRVVVLTNGVRLASDRAFAEELKRRDAYVSLQLDGFTAQAHQKLRGRDLFEVKRKALEVLEELDIPTQLLFVAARGVNEDQLGRAVELLLQKDHVLSLSIQPVAFTGRGGGTMGGDTLERLTIPGVLKAIEAQTAGAVRLSDFTPLPCPNPHCIALTFLLRLDDGTHLPFARFADLRKHGGLLRNSATLPALPEIEEALRDVVYHLFARRDETPSADKVLAALRRAMKTMFPDRPLELKEALRRGERQAKSIFVHHYMDAHDFDLERLRKCCHHYPQIDGRLMPACGFNLFHRGAAIGPDSPRAAWARRPWGGRE